MTSGKSSRYSSSSSISGIGQLTPAAFARRRYSPTVLLDTLQAPAIARLDNPASYFNLRISLIFRMVNRSWAMSTSLFIGR